MDAVNTIHHHHKNTRFDASVKEDIERGYFLTADKAVISLRQVASRVMRKIVCRLSG